MIMRTLTAIALALTGQTALADWEYEIVHGVPKAFAGLAKQIQRSHEAVDESISQARKNYADMMTELAIARMTVKTAFEYMQVGPNGNATGNTPFICSSQTIKESAEAVATLTRQSAQKWAETIYRVSNKNNKLYTKVFGPISVSYRMSVPFTNQSIVREVTHNERYCTQTESELGVCQLQPNGMQGADVDFSILYSNDTISSEKQVALTHFAARITPQITVHTTDASNCTSSTCKAASHSARAAEARISVARNTILKYIESRSTQNKNGSAGTLIN